MHFRDSVKVDDDGAVNPKESIGDKHLLKIADFVLSGVLHLNEDGEVADRGRFRTSPKAVEKWFTDLPPGRVAMEAGAHSIWISEQLQELGDEIIVANVREYERSPTVTVRATRSIPRSWGTLRKA